MIPLASSTTDPFENLALEEGFLGDRDPCEGILFLYVNRPCVVIGRNQNPWIEVAAYADLPVLRRASGGGAVYHDEGNLNWSIVASRDAHDRCAELGLVVKALSSLGIEAEADERGAIRIAGKGPFAGRKVCGSARRMLRDRVLHHGTLLVCADLGRMASSLGGIEVARSAAPASTPSRVVNLSAVANGLRVEDAAKALAAAMAGMSAEPAERPGEDEAHREAEARLRSWEWTYGATPPFAVPVGKGGGAALVEARRGLVAAVSGPGAPALEALVGARFDYPLPGIAEALLTRRAQVAEGS